VKGTRNVICVGKAEITLFCRARFSSQPTVYKAAYCFVFEPRETTRLLVRCGSFMRAGSVVRWSICSENSSLAELLPLPASAELRLAKREIAPE
jgi:hypothetical protein